LIKLNQHRESVDARNFARGSGMKWSHGISGTQYANETSRLQATTVLSLREGKAVSWLQQVPARRPVGVRYRITAVLTRASNTHWQWDEASKLTDYCC